MLGLVVRGAPLGKGSPKFISLLQIRLSRDFTLAPLCNLPTSSNAKKNDTLLCVFYLHSCVTLSQRVILVLDLLVSCIINK